MTAAGALFQISTTTTASGTSNDDSTAAGLEYPKCLPYETELANLVNASDQVFVTMPGKAAGTSMKMFVGRCTKTSISIICDPFCPYPTTTLAPNGSNTN